MGKRISTRQRKSAAKNDAAVATSASQFQPRSFTPAVDIPQQDAQAGLQTKQEDNTQEFSGDRPQAFAGNSNLSDPLSIAQRQTDGASNTPLLVGLPSIQPKLTVGAVGDKYEQEADSVAAQVVQRINSPQAQQKPEATVQREGEEEEEMQMKPLAPQLQKMEGPEEEEEVQMKPITPQLRGGGISRDFKKASLFQGVQRMGAEGGEASGTIEQQINNLRGKGNVLAPKLQTQMGSAMGADFSGVRIHTDSQSDQLNQSIQAKAFTTGQDVFFRKGEYNPGNKSGQELIAHELTHVVQQSGGQSNSQLSQPKSTNKNAIRMKSSRQEKIGRFSTPTIQPDTSLTLRRKKPDSKAQAIEMFDADDILGKEKKKNNEQNEGMRLQKPHKGIELKQQLGLRVDDTSLGDLLECDVNKMNADGERDAERLVYSPSTNRVWYTSTHYKKTDEGGDAFEEL